MSKFKNANLVEGVEPQFLTLAGTGANRVAFRIVRGESKAAAPTTKIQQRSRKSSVQRNDGVLSITVPSTLGVSEVDAIKTTYGVTDQGYETTTTESGTTFVKREDIDYDHQQAVDMADGVTVNVAMPKMVAEGDAVNGVSIYRYEIGSATAKDEGAARIYLEDMDVDTSVMRFDAVDGGHTVTRTDIPEPKETLTVQVQDGVSCLVCRVDGLGSTPASLVGVIAPVVYGNFGWGHVDFAAAMADVNFSNVAEKALYLLRDVLDNIIFWNDHAPAIRKTLLNNAVDEYKSYMGALIDTLPAPVVALVRSDTSRIKRKDDMLNLNGKEKTVTKPQPAESEMISRKDADAATKVAVDAALAPKDTTEEVTRTDAVAPKEEVTAEDPAPATPTEEVTRTDADPAPEVTAEDPVLAAIARMESSMNEKISGIESKVETVVKRQDTLAAEAEGTVVVRSDADADDNHNDETVAAKRSDEGGSFSGIFGF
jgi:hypothetical protein